MSVYCMHALPRVQERSATVKQHDVDPTLQAAATAIAQATTPEVASAQASAIAQAYASGKPTLSCMSTCVHSSKAYPRG